MKLTIKSMLLVLIAISALNSFGQVGSTGFNKRPVKMNTGSSGTTVAIGLKNLCEKPVIVYVGPKDELTKPAPRQKVYEGLSNNTIYVSINEVVCIMHESGKPVACVDVMAGEAEMEIDESGTAISTK